MNKEPKIFLGFTLTGACLSVLIIVLCTACTQSSNRYKAAEIDFLNVKTLEEGDWIEIDGVRFNHAKAYEEVEANVFTLPASRITRGGQNAEKMNLQNPFHPQILGICWLHIFTI